MKRFDFVYSVIFFLLTLIGSCFGQAVGFPPFSTLQNGSNVETINLANLNVHIRIPIVSKAGRIPFEASYDYDSSIVYLSQSVFGLSGTWRDPGQYFGLMPRPHDDSGYCEGGTSFLGLEFVDRLGTHHRFTQPLLVCSLGPYSATQQTNDGSGIQEHLLRMQQHNCLKR